MSHYGEIIGGNIPNEQMNLQFPTEQQQQQMEQNNYSINYPAIYNLFVDYFENPQLVKVEQKETNSIYMCKNYCMLGNKCRYIIAVVPLNQEPIGSQRQLSTLNWESIQTRLLYKKYPINSLVIQKKTIYSKILR